MTPKADFQSTSSVVRTEPVQQRSNERITSLLDAAAALIDESGIDGLTTSDVATRSGSSVGVVYRYYPNIQSLLRALAARNMEKFQSRITTAVTTDGVDWLGALDRTIDSFIEMMLTEPGFRALGFGDVIDDRFLQAGVTNNTVLARLFRDLYVSQSGVEPSEQFFFDLEVIVEIADGILRRAFVYKPEGDERFISKLRSIVSEYMGKYQIENPAA